jgi:putative transferase (TIGR04331 family)
VRLALSDQGQGAFLRWHERFPNIQVDVGLNKITNLMQEARLVVLTYNQTGMLESLASGIPTILFCDLKVTPLCEMAIPYYAELKGVGIFHDTPESAALHVNMVWSDVDAWWCRVDVQDAVTHFTNEYCRRSKNILDGIENVLRDVIEEISN